MCWLTYLIIGIPLLISSLNLFVNLFSLPIILTPAKQICVVLTVCPVYFELYATKYMYWDSHFKVKLPAPLFLFLSNIFLKKSECILKKSPH